MKKANAAVYKAPVTVSAILTAISVLSGIASAPVSLYMVSVLRTDGGQIRVIVFGFIIFALQILKAVFNALALWKEHKAAYSSLFSIRSAIIDHLKKLPLSFFQKRKTGELAGVVDNDIERIEIYLAHTLPEILATVLVCALSFAALVIVNWGAALIIAVMILLIGVIMGAVSPFWKGSIGAYQDSMRTVSSGIMEYIGTISVIKAFRAGETRTQKVLADIEDYIAKAKRAIYVQTVPMGLIAALVEGSVAAVAVAGCYKFLGQSGQIAVSDILRFILAIILTGIFTQNMMKATGLMYNKTVYDHTMKAVDDIILEPAVSIEKKGLAATAGDIVFQNVSFSYGEGEPALVNINAVFAKNTISAIVGPSGAGKSTIAGLLSGFWRRYEGSITMDGRAIESIPDEELAALITVVQQENFLLNISIAENIRIGKPDATDDEITEAAKKAQIHETITALPNGYGSIAGEGGAKLSGGEKQRVSLARMMLKDAPILILDEATAAIDPYNEALIQKAVSNLCKDKTLIVIAHHLSTVKNAGQIIVLDKGGVQAAGRHGDLLAGCDLYKKMWAAQSEAENWSIRKGGAI